MGFPGTTDSSVYTGLKDVLQRQPQIDRVTYEPDTIRRRFLRGTVNPSHIEPSTGPESPIVDVEWRFSESTQFYRIHYADPNTGFNCGWHRDHDHPEYGPVHFQYENPETGSTGRECAEFEKTVPTELLWSALDRLFEEWIPELTQDW